MKGKTPVKINEVQFLVEVKTQAERPGSLICSTNWNWLFFSENAEVNDG